MMRRSLYQGVGSFLNILHLNLKKSYNMLTITMLISSLAYFIYTLITAARKATSFQNLLHENPTITIMIIVASLNIIVAYSLWYFKENLLTSRALFSTAIIAIIIQQLLLGNIITTIFAISNLYFYTDIPTSQVHISRSLLFGLLITTIVYAFCLWALFRVTF